MPAPPSSERRVTAVVGRAGDARSDSVEMVGWSAMEISSLAGTALGPAFFSCEDVADVARARKRVRIFLSHVEVPHLTVGPNVRGRCELAHIGGCNF